MSNGYSEYGFWKGEQAVTNHQKLLEMNAKLLFELEQAREKLKVFTGQKMEAIADHYMLDENERLESTIERMRGLQRYDISTTPYLEGASMKRSENGDWVSADEIETELQD